MRAFAMERSKISWGAKKAQEVNAESRPENQGGVGTKPATDTEAAKFEGSSTVAPEAWPSLGVLE